MAEEVANPKIVITAEAREAIRTFLETGKASADLGKAVETLGKQFDVQSVQSKKSEQSIKRLMDSVSGAGAAGKMNELAEAVKRLGGAESLTAAQTDNLARRIESLKSQGAAVHASLANVTSSVSKFDAALKGAGTQQLATMSSNLGPLGGALAAIGPAGMIAAAGIGATAGAVAGLANLASSAAVWADKIKDTSIATGMTVESVQRLEHAANAAEIPLEKVTGAVLKMQRAMLDAPQHFKSLGLEMEQLRALSPEQQLVAIGEKLKLIEDPVVRNNIALGIFNKSWAELAPLIMEGLGAMKDATVVSDETIDKLDNLRKETNLLGAEWDKFTLSLGAAAGKERIVVATVQAMTDSLRLMSKQLKEGGITEFLKDMASGAAGLLFQGQTGGSSFRKINLGKPQGPISRADADREDRQAIQGEREARELNERLAREAREAEREAAAEARAKAQRKAQRAQEEADKRAKFLAEMGPQLPSRGFLEARELLSDRGPVPLQTTGLISGPRNQAEAMASGIGLTELNRIIDQGKGLWTRYGDVVDAELSDAGNNTKEIVSKTVDWHRQLADVANVAELLGGTLAGKVVGAVAGVGAAFDSLNLKNASGGFSLTGGAGLSGLIGNVGAVGQMASIGLTVGKALGKAIGDALSESGAEKAAKEYGVKLSEAVAEGIDSDSKRLGDKFAAGLVNMKGIIADGGGVQAFGAGKAAGMMRDLFSTVERGQVSLAEAGKVFDENFGEVAAANVSKTTGKATAQLMELVGLARNFKIESPALMEFLRGQSTAAASNIGAGLAGVKSNRERGGKGLANQTAATGISATVAGDFQGLLDSGMSVREAIDVITPSVTAMREELKAAGLEGSAAFHELEARVAVMTGAITGPLISSTNGFSAAAINMHNTGGLTAEMFAGITAQIGTNIAALQEEGVVGPAAIQALQPDLQKIWELQKATGFAVDETTQGLIDQAVQAGAVGENHVSAADKMAAASERTAAAVEFLAAAFGYMGGEADKAMRDRSMTLKVNEERSTTTTGGGVMSTPSGTPIPTEAPPGFERGTDFREFGAAGTLAVLHNKEAVVPFEERFAFARSIMERANFSVPQMPDFGAAMSSPASTTRGGGAAGGPTVHVTFAPVINGANGNPDEIVARLTELVERGLVPQFETALSGSR